MMYPIDEKKIDDGQQSLYSFNHSENYHSSFIPDSYETDTEISTFLNQNEVKKCKYKNSDNISTEKNNKFHPYLHNSQSNLYAKHIPSFHFKDIQQFDLSQGEEDQSIQATSNTKLLHKKKQELVNSCKETNNYLSFEKQECHKIQKFLIENSEFSNEFNNLIVQKKFNVDRNVIIQKLEEKISDIKKKIQSCQNRTNVRTHFFDYSNYNSRNFCFFCVEKNCKMFSQTFVKSTKNLESFIQNFKIGVRSANKPEIFSFLTDIYFITQKTKNCDIHFFINFFKRQRIDFFKLFDIFPETNLRISKRTKLNLIQEIFHNFKCDHSIIKIRLIPEFLPLLFLLLNRTVKVYSQHNNVIFFIFLFYVNSFNQIFDVISRYNLFQTKESEDKKKTQNIHKNLISLLLRINFVEPLIILIIRSESAVQRYRLNTLLLFHLQCQSFENQTHNSEKMEFLLQSICWVFHSTQHLHPGLFAKIFEANNFKGFFSLNMLYFNEIINLLDKFKENEPYLDSNSFMNDVYCENFKIFIETMKIVF